MCGRVPRRRAAGTPSSQTHPRPGKTRDGRTRVGPRQHETEVELRRRRAHLVRGPDDSVGGHVVRLRRLALVATRADFASRRNEGVDSNGGQHCENHGHDEDRRPSLPSPGLPFHCLRAHG